MKQIKLKKIKVEISKLVTMAEMGLGVVRPLNREKKGWIAKLKKEGAWDPILVTPIKDSGYYLLTDGWHRVQAAKGLKRKDNKRNTNAGQRGPEHGQGQQDPEGHRQGVRFPTALQ
jgi:hypothetical protein